MGWRERLRLGGSKKHEENAELDCERLIKLKGSKLEIAGIEFETFKLGKIGYESTLRQTVNQSIILLDASQYDLCKAIKGLKDPDKKQKYIEMMVDDKFKSKRITEALAGLLTNPESKELQTALKLRLLENTSRLEELDSNKERLDKYRDHNLEDVLETGNVSLTSSLTSLKKSAATEIVEEDMTNMNIPGTETSIKNITKQAPSDSFNPEDYYFSPDGTYAIHNPPQGWRVRDITMLEFLAEKIGIDNQNMRDFVFTEHAERAV